jgi:hypothetical protein
MRRPLVLAAFHVLVILGWASYHEYVWATAPTFRIPLRPRDPYDLIRGRYFILNPQDAAFDSNSTHLPQEEIERLLGSSIAFEGGVRVGFCPSGAVHRVCALARQGETSAGAARYWSKGFATVTQQDRGWRLQLDLGLRRFFIPNRIRLPAPENQEGWELEVSHRPGQSPLPRRLFFRGSPIDLR